jgi:hypothetical protein
MEHEDRRELGEPAAGRGLTVAPESTGSKFVSPRFGLTAGLIFLAVFIPLDFVLRPSLLEAIVIGVILAIPASIAGASIDAWRAKGNGREGRK